MERFRTVCVRQTYLEACLAIINNAKTQQEWQGLCEPIERLLCCLAIVRTSLHQRYKTQ
jgi:hypothetical protein